ncbi:ZIP zinc/iron transport family [Vararia minispora EC-137]|uniref:ZIP zinc/iron transport family n=1 Tax=Vararia minispora EC-137 TaxID=1314806 RepID=A0ACB8QQ83_9AGAM|nr:ZIP zinc/iron transport family [Vararia minispora EC-137]
MSSASACSSGGGSTTYTGLRIASIFIILATSTAGALFPVLARRTSLGIPKPVFEFAKYFGSGVIIATAFIHLLSPALGALSSACLSDAWLQYPYALAIALVSIFGIFIAEFAAFRIGTARLKRMGMTTYDPHGHQAGGAHAAHGPEVAVSSDAEAQAIQKSAELESVEYTARQDTLEYSAFAQLIGIAVLEFGVMLHSVLIGLTLAVDENFRILFVVLIFHQTFEGLGIGSRLAFLDLPKHGTLIPVLAAIAYGLTTPIGIAAGLGVRTTYNPGTARASIVSGVLDATSAGILIYTGLVELLAHEFIFSQEMREASNAKVLYAIGCMMFGCGVMALLGRWA